jgi:hypothetical protein
MYMKTNTATLDRILTATALSDLDDSREPNAVFKRFARKCHPDMYEDGLKALAKQAFQHLTDLKDKATGADKKASSSGIKTKKHNYDLGSPVWNKDDVLITYPATYDAGFVDCFFSITKDPRDSDLTEAAVHALRKLNEVPEDYRKFFPELVETFRYRDEATGVDRPIIVTDRIEGFRPLSDVLKVYPNGIGGRDVAWIFRRMLVAIGNAHDVGLIHGAPTMDAFQIHAEMHGIILGNWHYSVSDGDPLKAVPSNWSNLYPGYALKKDPVSYRLDIEIASKTAAALLNKDEPRQLFAFFKGCSVTSTPKASELMAEFDNLLLRLYGNPRFNPFTLEPNKTN